ncbi:MAG: lysophospholipid acyltransferase family protein [Planctomycetota bacterium]
MFKGLFNHLGYAVLWGLFRLLLFLPFRAAGFLGDLLGALTYHLGRRERNRALRHLRWGLGDVYSRGERRAIALRMFRNFSRATAEALAGTKLSTEELESHVENAGEMEAHLKNICAEGAGMLGMTGHLGNWELLGTLAGRYVPINVVANRFHFEPFNRLAEALRTAGKMKVIYLNESPREIVRALKRSEVVAILPDLDIRRLPGTYVRFFGRPAWTPIGPVLTGKVSGAPLVPYFMVRRGSKYRVLIGDRIPLDFTGHRRRDAYVNTQRWSDIYEDHIRRYPDQWAWSHLRWNTTPSEVAPAFRRNAALPSQWEALAGEGG